VRTEFVEQLVLNCLLPLLLHPEQQEKLMQPSKMTIYELFEKQRRYVVPLFQRPYVWERERQWEPLWGDISGKALQVYDERNEKRELSSHFLGAAVINEIKTFGRQVTARQVIDGQQRLTTLQVLLVALRDFARNVGVESIARDLDRLTTNDCRMEQPYEKYKVWPTTADQSVFEEIYNAGSPETVSAKYPLVKIKYSNKFTPRPRLIEAYLFFYQSIEEYVLDIYDGDESTSASQLNHLTEEQEDRIDALLETIQKYLELVVIELEDRDDPQIIFETLNARGEPLLPSDLIRNFVFLEAAKKGENPDLLYQNLWKQYDINDSFWQKEERQGRLYRPRIDLFMFHYLTFKTERDLTINQLFEAFRIWWSSQKQQSVETQLREIERYSKLYESFFNGQQSSRLGVFVQRLQTLDTSTVYPLILFLYGERVDINPTEREGILDDIESYLVRRMVCRLTTQNYNRFFLGILRQLRKETTITRDKVRQLLMESRSATTRFPSDAEFYQSWQKPVYGYINQNRVAMILEAIDLAMETGKQEATYLAQKLTIEHIRPQNPASEQDWQVLPSENEEIIHTFGNLTLLSAKLNTTISNGAFSKKRPEIAKQSKLRLNTYFQDFSDRDIWDIDKINTRTEALFNIAKNIWAYPSDGTVNELPVLTSISQEKEEIIQPDKDTSDDKIYRYLQRIAREERTIPYIEIARMANLNMERQVDRNELGRILGAISEYEYEQGRPLLSVVVVFSNEGTPSNGFYNLANQLGELAPIQWRKSQETGTFQVH
jgi:uncharacterized protein with ParB-like and HNH nuclease domain